MGAVLALTSVELCAGAGGQALGVEQAGFGHEALVELDKHACETLRLNRPNWPVFEEDLNSPTEFDAGDYVGIDLLAGGLPCPPFSVAGKQLGEQDERNLFDRGVELVDEIRPSAVMFENVKGMLNPSFDDYRGRIGKRLKKLGYTHGWKLLNASDFGVPQLRPRVVLVAVRSDRSGNFEWPDARDFLPPKTVGETLHDLMAIDGWAGADAWRDAANRIAPTVVGGSKKHGGPDLGPTRAKRAWKELDVDGMGIANEPPAPGFNGIPRLTVQMVARLQGFPDEWEISGRKTNAYRQVGNAFPPPVAKAVASKIAAALSSSNQYAVAV
ncbi:MAG: DNA (cytosine-5-)-methyltransferase [Parvibaculum sp.]|jgi:DNA (cytosine-5)-methyltransferase 1|nr:DNA (cytosine-5-)-methyltransferase [Parvibaculum sp.]|tara:strand:- start:2411 stop:3391 length:981 start_codon:yes stop_codon:yes gene_type:complete